MQNRGLKAAYLSPIFRLPLWHDDHVLQVPELQILKLFVQPEQLRGLLFAYLYRLLKEEERGVKGKLY